MRRNGLLDLQSHRRLRAALGELLLERLEQVVGAIVDLQVGVARHAEGVVLDDLHAGEELIEVRGDHLLERREAAVLRERHEPGQQRRHLDAREVHAACRGIAHQHGQVQRQVRDVRERAPRVHRQGRQHGKDLLAEHRVQLVALSRLELAPAQHPHARGIKRGLHVLGEHLSVLLGQRDDLGRDRRQRLLRREAVGRARPDPRLSLLLEAGHAHLEELVHVRGEDREELRPLEQRYRTVLGERQHARVEVDRRQLPVQEAVSGPRSGRGAGRADVAYSVHESDASIAWPNTGRRALGANGPRPPFTAIGRPLSCREGVASAVRQIYQPCARVLPARPSQAEVTRSGEKRYPTPK